MHKNVQKASDEIQKSLYGHYALKRSAVLPLFSSLQVGILSRDIKSGRRYSLRLSSLSRRSSLSVEDAYILAQIMLVHHVEEWQRSRGQRKREITLYQNRNAPERKWIPLTLISTEGPTFQLNLSSCQRSRVQLDSSPPPAVLKRLLQQILNTGSHAPHFFCSFLPAQLFTFYLRLILS